MKNKVTAMVYSPARDHHLREGDGFSISEIEKSERTIEELKRLNIKIDYNRRSSHPFNIEKLNTLDVPEVKYKSREPFVKKEKKRTPFIPQEIEEKEELPPKVKEEKEEIPKAEEVKEEGELIPLNELDGVGPATEEKFKQLGINSVQDLIKENPKELGMLIKGVSKNSVSEWIKQGKKLLKK
jgi:ribosomal protein L13E